MPTHAQLLAQMFWEATGDHLRRTLEPDLTDSPRTPDELAEAYFMAYRALNALEHAFNLNSRLQQALDRVSVDPTEPQAPLSRNAA